jgi:Na+-translocating ferredoxin:NAD+ oxidoreductase RnfD subunit
MKRLLKSLLCEDKLKHVVVSAIMAVVLNLLLPWWVAGLLTLAIGVGKEVYDKVSGKGHAEWEDLVADVVGVVIGLL